MVCVYNQNILGLSLITDDYSNMQASLAALLLVFLDSPPRPQQDHFPVLSFYDVL